jgi:site-specific recombinase XerD
MIDSIFLVKSVRERHRTAPLIAERERYLSYLLEIGTRRERVRNVASMLLHVIRLLKLDSFRPVGMDEILEGCERWVEDFDAHRHRRSGLACRHTFRVVATNWLRHQGALTPAPRPTRLFGDLLDDFLDAMRSKRGFASETLRSYRSRILAFLNWLQPRCSEFSQVRASDVEEYLETKRLNGWSRSSFGSHCIALKTFFGYAEQQRWCLGGIRGSICSPRLPRIAENLNGPAWDDVRRLLASIGDLKPADLRAKAMFLLFSVYGLRSSEVRGLALEDIDWRRESIIVRRAKRGKTQQFPLQAEVGKAIALYLRRARPQCSCRNLFVTLHPPYRPVLGHTMSGTFYHRVKKLGMATHLFGPHMLRRACATQLLRTGTPLKDIADFLGHSDLRSVSAYAKFDPDSLKNVAKFSLRGVM